MEPVPTEERQPVQRPVDEFLGAPAGTFLKLADLGVVLFHRFVVPVEVLSEAGTQGIVE